MKRYIPSLKKTALFVFVIVVFFLYLSTPRRDSVVIRLHDDQIEIQKMNNAIAQFIIEEGYGYKVELVETTIKEVKKHLIQGDVDVTLELWKENNQLWYEEASGEGLIDNLGVIYSGGKQYWIVSEWFAKERGISTVFDMQQHWEAFVDPEDPSKGLFFNCIFGWACMDINRVKLQAYGLDRYFNTVSPVSPESLRTIYENARSRGLPVFGYYWEPNAIMMSENWRILEEPPYSNKVWSKVIKAATSPDQPPPEEACSYNDSRVYKIANSDLAKKAPEVVRMLEKMEIDIFLINTILFEEPRNKKEDISPQELALHFLKNYPDQWESWMPKAIKNKVKKALANKSSEALEK